MEKNTEALRIAAAYIRVSTDDQVEYSPESQLKVIQDHAKREGYIIPDGYVYQDDGISGKTASKRPAFRLMIATAKAEHPPFECIFVWKYSRFARNQEEAIMYKNLLKKRGVAVRSVSEPSSDSPFASLIERIIEWMDEYYLINLSGEVRRGMTEKATRGEAMGTAPYGYTVQNKTFVVNENADTVRYIFSSYLSGKGMRAIASELGAKGVRTRRGSVPDNRWVQYILENPTYIGKIRWSSDGRANYSRRDYNGDNVMIVDGNHEPIIDTETWNAVQEKLSGSRREIKYARQNRPVTMLRGLLRCGNCGATLTPLSTKEPTYQCNRYSRGQCRVSHSISMGKANRTVIAALEQIVSDRSFTFAPRPPKKGQIVHDWDALISSEERKLDRAKNAMLDGAFTTAEYMSVKAAVEDNIKKLRAGKDAEQEEKTVDIAVYTKKVMPVLEAVKSPDISEEAKNAALRSVIDKIVYCKEKSSFDFYFVP